MQFRKSPIAVAALALFGALPFAAHGQTAGTPYSGTPASLPGTIRAADFDKGGEGVGYHDLSAGNLGGQYRTSEAVDIYPSADTASGPYQIANFQNGEWMSYTVNVPASGNYDLGINAANNYGVGAFHIEVDGANVTGSVPVAMTGGWTTYKWFGKQGIALSAGKHVLKLVAEKQWFNVSALTAQAGAGGTSQGGSTTPAYAGTPYSGTPAALPAAIPAVNFDKGGEGVAYHDLSSGNLGGLLRTSEAVDIYASADTVSGPYQVQNFQTGEWMNYSVNVPADGNYDVGIRASNNMSAGAFHIEVDGKDVTGSIPVAKTGGWTTYQWFGKQGVALSAGPHVVKLVADDQWFNVSALSVLASGSGGSTSTGGTNTGGSTAYAGTPFSGTPTALPGTLAAANFDKGGEGVAYHDLSAGNLGALYRTSEAVDIYASTDTVAGQYQVANFQTGEWMNYTVNVAANGNYDLGIRAANNMTAGAFHIEVDGKDATGSIPVGATGGWTTYQWFGKTAVPLTAGKHVLKLVADKQWFNVSGLTLAASGSSSTGSTNTGGNTGGGSGTKPANMVFWSGFDGALSFSTPSDCYNNGCFQQLTGSDTSTGYSWPLVLNSGTNRFQLLSNSSTTPDANTIGNWMYNQVQTVVGHKGNSTKALYSEVLQSGCCGTDGQGGGSTQDAFHVLPGSEVGDFYMSKWLKLQPDLVDKLHASSGWRVVFEMKEGSTSGGAFRAILNITAYDGAPPSWQVRWDNDANGGLPFQEFWRAVNTTVPVPVGEWFKLEVYWHRAKDSTGRVWFAVNGQVIDDHHGTTIGVRDDPVGRIFINQVYTGGVYPAYQWMDDIQVWKTFPTVSSSDPWYDPPYAPH